MFQITSGFSRSRLLAQQLRLAEREVERAQHLETFMRLAQIGMRFLDDDAGLREALRRLARDGDDFRIDRRDAEIGRIGDAFWLRCRIAPPSGTRSAAPAATADRRMLAAHGIEQQREVVDIARHRALDAERADRSGGRDRARRGRCWAAVPTTPQKLAGLRSEPPMSEPCASQAMPVASATAAPPDEPAAERDVSQGLRVAPNTSLKVLAPAPNSGVFDLA